ncbi:MAG: T9SS type A sorting domain-containing protein [Bacteroidales bacterium]|nr:T9SS type A sorting domain-containing protein [Bacteroidales bacterium]
MLLQQFDMQAQEYFPFPQDSAVWYSVYQWPAPYPPYIYYRTYKYEAKGDTIINDFEYTKLYWSPVNDSDNKSGYEGAYRVDIENDKVYFIDSYYNTESLLYDFSLVPGDTITISGTDYDPFNLVCLDTTTILINGVPHKKLLVYSYLSNGTECYTNWVEGIGSLRMPIETDEFCAGFFEWMYDLTCFFYKDEQIYEWEENPYFEGCIGTNVGIEKCENEKSFAVIPNPVAGTSHLVCNTSNNTLFDYQIIDVNGNVLQSALGVKPDDILIQNSHFSNGIYLLRLYSHNIKQYFSIKFIIN